MMLPALRQVGQRLRADMRKADVPSLRLVLEVTK
jgi:hypothetical protein